MPYKLTVRLAVVGFVVGSLMAGLHGEASGDLKRASQLEQQGRELVERSQYVQAEARFRDMQLNCENNVQCSAVADAYLGRCCLETSRYDEAIRYLDSALRKIQGNRQPLIAGIVHHLKARALQDKEAFDPALEEFGQAEQILSSCGEAGRKELTLVLLNCAEMQARLYNYDEARKNLEMAANLCRGNEQQCLMRMKFVRAVVSARSQDPSARSEFEEVLKYYEKRIDKSNQAQILIELGYLNESRDDLQTAEHNFSKALEIARDLQDGSRQASALNNRGLISVKRGNYTQASRDFEEAYRLSRSLRQDRKALLAMANIGLVYLYSRSDRYDHAQKTLESAYQEAREKGYVESQAYAAHNLALLYRDQGRFLEAMAKSEEAVELAGKLRDKKLQARALFRCGNLLEYYGFFEGANEKYAKAEQIQKTMGDRFFQATTLLHLATLSARGVKIGEGKSGLGYAPDPRRYFDRALGLRNEIGAPMGEVACAYALYLMEKERYQGGVVGETELRQAQQLLTNQTLPLEARRDKTTSLLLTFSTGRFLYHKKKYSEAIQKFQELQEDPIAKGNLKYSFLSNVGLGATYEAQQQWGAAERAYEQAVAYAERIRNTLDRYERRYFLHGEPIFGVKHIDPYEGLARVRFKKGETERSWEASELTRARGLSDKLEQSLLKDLETKAPKLAEKLAQAERELRQVNQQLELRPASRSEGTAEIALKDQLSVAEKGVNKAREELKKAYPSLYEILYAEPGDMRKSALRDNEWVLMYEVTDSGVLAYLANGGKIQRAEFFPIPRGELKRRVDNYRKPMQNFGNQTDDAIKEFTLKEGKALYAELVSPMISSVPEHALLTICADEFLALLPFEALVVGSGGQVDRQEWARLRDVEFLSDRHVISYYQSVRLLTLLRGRWKSKGMSGKDYLVIADPIVNEKCLRGCDTHGSSAKPLPIEATSDRKAQIDAMGYRPSEGVAKAASLGPMEGTCYLSGFGRLRETTGLANYLKKEFGAECYEGENATLASFKKVVPHFNRYATIVFATHGVAEMAARGLDEPALLLSTTEACQDNWLTMKNVYPLGMNADLVWLLACETGMGRDIAGEGVMHMGSAFQIAGSRSVVVGLWELPEQASVELARLFFEELKSGKAKAEALQEAKNKLRQQSDGIYSHPYWWAGITLVGEPDSEQ